VLGEEGGLLGVEAIRAGDQQIEARGARGRGHPRRSRPRGGATPRPTTAGLARLGLGGLLDRVGLGLRGLAGGGCLGLRGLDLLSGEPARDEEGQ
jgi:hypothetical protein